MNKNTLYLMMGRPGAGKTTAAQVICDITGSTHLWTAKIRVERYGRPSFKHSENIAIYDHMNRMADELLAAGNDVVFDTSFNYYADRQKLRKIADEHEANTVVVWVQTPKDLARDRATKDAHLHDTRILGDMSEADFERLAEKLEKPQPGETVIELDGTKITREHVAAKLRK